MECPRCGKEIPEDSKFCPFCGKRIPANNAPVQRKKRRRAKGTGTVFQVKGKVHRNKSWIAKDGEGQFIGYFETPGEAVIALDAWNALTRPKQLRAKITFAEFYEIWKPQHDKGISEKSQKDTDNYFSKAASLHKRIFAELRTIDYQEIIDELEADGASLSQVQKQKKLFKQMCDYAMQNDLINQNYGKYCKITATEIDPEKHDHVYTPEEVEAISLSIGTEYDRTAKILYVLLYTGFRISELLLMERKHVHLKEGYMVGGSKTKAGKDRIVPIHDKIRPIIEGWMSDHASSIYLIQNAKGTENPVSYRNFNRDYHKLMDHLGIDGTTAYNTRHTFGTRMLEVSDKPDVIKKVIGHASITTTINTYDHPDIEAARKEISKLK